MRIRGYKSPFLTSLMLYAVVCCMHIRGRCTGVITGYSDTNTCADHCLRDGSGQVAAALPFARAPLSGGVRRRLAGRARRGSACLRGEQVSATLCLCICLPPVGDFELLF